MKNHRILEMEIQKVVLNMKRMTEMLTDKSETLPLSWIWLIQLLMNMNKQIEREAKNY